MLCPTAGPAQNLIQSNLFIDPINGLDESVDLYGNLCHRVIFPPGITTVTAECQAEVADEIDVDPDAPFVSVSDLPPELMHYLLPSRYCQSDLMLALASKIVRRAQPGYAQVEAIRSWIRRKVKYKYGSSGPSTSALDTAKSRKGVCRDFSHLGIALCRAIRIPARIVSGYLYQLDPMDLHLWFEAYLGGRWYTFDATQDAPRGNRIVVAYGRDAADVAMLSEYGPLSIQQMNVWVNA
jgi:transglutaminase-like putative cysteine protease